MMRYGQFGIAFHKLDAIDKGQFNPVLYLHKKAFLFQQASDLLKNIDGMVSVEDSLYENLQKFLLTLGSYIKPSDLSHPAVIDRVKDEEQNNNFYYEREWRSVDSWKFDVESIAAIMMPSQYIELFNNKLVKKFSNCSIIASEMVKML
jgi:Putative abortive phage resistance protein AbiGi, antitoxin